MIFLGMLVELRNKRLHSGNVNPDWDIFHGRPLTDTYNTTVLRQRDVTGLSQLLRRHILSECCLTVFGLLSPLSAQIRSIFSDRSWQFETRFTQNSLKRDPPSIPYFESGFPCRRTHESRLKRDAICMRDWSSHLNVVQYSSRRNSVETVELDLRDLAINFVLLTYFWGDAKLHPADTQEKW